VIDPSVRALRYFVATADHGNVTQAAKLLHVSQPSVSLAIAQLEQTLGLRLFVRQHSRGMALTPAGRDVLREARKLLAQASDFSATAAGNISLLRGALSVGCLTYLVPCYLAAIISGFCARYPAIDVSFREGDQDELQRAMLDGHIELALTYDLQLSNRFETEVLLELSPYALVPAGHRLAKRKAISLHNIVSEPCVLLDLPISRVYLPFIFGTLGLRPNVRHRTTSVEALRSLVGNGLGYSVLNHPSKTMTTYDGKRTQVLKLVDRLPRAKVAAVHIAGHKPRPIADVFIAYAREFFQRERPAGKGGREPAAPRFGG
jgi:DNA-binding transcriptional LysR family regulator